MFSMTWQLSSAISKCLMPDLPNLVPKRDRDEDVTSIRVADRIDLGSLSSKSGTSRDVFDLCMLSSLRSPNIDAVCSTRMRLLSTSPVDGDESFLSVIVDNLANVRDLTTNAGDTPLFKAASSIISWVSAPSGSSRLLDISSGSPSVTTSAESCDTAVSPSDEPAGTTPLPSLDIMTPVSEVSEIEFGRLKRWLSLLMLPRLIECDVDLTILADDIERARKASLVLRLVLISWTNPVLKSLAKISCGPRWPRLTRAI
ncbi:nuclear fragile X mental retardation-interacting protein 1, putative [Babesia ovis]|uniref:Nuclear fragile X mental retardation-interacting protein 1, putative n=1 Tax=Babesia ovis TaxID=5869 RepID=A0A9W5WWM9_BABOV|nr:nuclear fragile X mental retardation-interacting protein 1, putative [Babesia ovis]